MPPECPECGRRLRERGPNLLANLRRREVEDIRDRYVCENCQTTYADDEIVNETETNIKMKQWYNE